MRQCLAAALFFAMPPAMEQYGGDWDGSNVHEDHVEFLRNTRRLPGADKVEVRLAPAKEIRPEPQEGERTSGCRPSSSPYL